ncbi:magnesium/cobalt transporter CorA [Kocuria tytonis]|uniref:Magnesium transport protein CorA n=1 Tax=Kocuria tytonis TaxID=2054280 RepID=A0A495A9V5_9MICC|nr:magnesium/cobalt transporter CorA [Kocuria tytonis]RKQ36861.1 magnesium and cobalt transport protein CorA [Kocuria tytonis]
MTIVENAIYRNGKEVESPTSLEDTYDLLQRVLDRSGGEQNSGSGGRDSVVAWIGLYRPSAEEIRSLSEHFDLHELAVEDTVQAHQRPKMERYGNTLFTVIRPAVYQDETETVEIGEIHIFTGPNFVITIRHSESSGVSRVRKRVEADPELLCFGPDGVLYALLDQIVDDYFPVLSGLENDIDEIEDALFAGESNVSQRIYELAREINDFHRGAAPLSNVMQRYFVGFTKYGTHEELQHRLRDVLDHVIAVTGKLESMRSSLTDAMSLDSTLTTARQNEAAMVQNDQMKKISSWAAILFAPSIVGSIYGMNFKDMPELEWAMGYPMALVLMLLVAVVLYVVFKTRDWL